MALLLSFASICAVPIAFALLFAFGAVYMRQEHGRIGLLVFTLPGMAVIGFASAVLSLPSFFDEVLEATSTGSAGVTRFAIGAVVVMAAAVAVEVRARRAEQAGGLRDFLWAAVSAVAVALLALALFWVLLFSGRLDSA